MNPILLRLPLLALLAVSPLARALTINPTFDSSITFDPQVVTIEATINAAIAVYEADFSDPITVNITFQQMTNGLGSSSTLTQHYPYANVRAALLSHTTTIDDATALACLPNTAVNPVNGNTDVYLKLAQARALGLTSATGSPDSTISLNLAICNLSAAQTNAAKYSLFAVVAHEIDEALASGSALDNLTNDAAIPTGPVYLKDLFRYNPIGTRSFSTATNAVAYFSIDGTTPLARYNQTEGGDFGDWYSLGGQTPQVQDAYGTPGSAPVLGVELRMLDVLGYTRSPTPVWVDFQFAGTPAGTYLAPDSTLVAGVAAVNPGNPIVIKAGNSSEAITISKPMHLMSFGGLASIGLPAPLPMPLAKVSAINSPAAEPDPNPADGEILTTIGGMNLALPNH